jgi:anti-sigma B factor antagonist
MQDPSDFVLERHGDTLVVAPSGSVETLQWSAVEQAADLVLGPLGEHRAPLVVFDLFHLQIFGSVFLALLLRCHKLVRSHGGELVLCNVNPAARGLLQLTALDTLWAIYDTRDQALEAIGA